MARLTLTIVSKAQGKQSTRRCAYASQIAMANKDPGIGAQEVINPG